MGRADWFMLLVSLGAFVTGLLAITIASQGMTAPDTRCYGGCIYVLR